MTTTIGVIGASGQVNTEVCLYLKTYPEVRPVAVVRTSISGALLRRLGIEVRVGAFGTESESRELLRLRSGRGLLRARGRGERHQAHCERYVRHAVACAPEGRAMCSSAPSTHSA